MQEINLSHKTNLLEQDPYSYQLQDVGSPELFHEMFPYSETPKIAFNYRHVPANMPDDIYITDTSFRDGQQSRAPYTTDQMVHIFKLLHKLGGDNGMIRQTEFFVYSKKDRLALEKCMELGYKFPEITTWIRANKKDFDMVKSIGVKETGILVSCSDYHIFHKMGLTRKQALDKYLGIVKECINAGLRPRCHFEDITRADFYGFVVPFASQLMQISQECHIPIKVRACDTLGLGVPYPGVALPRSVSGIIYGLQHYAGVPSDMIEWHGHNDFHKVLANGVCAWLYGCSAVNGTFLGFGERTGNPPVEGLVFDWMGITGIHDGIDTTAITDMAEFFRKEINYPIPANYPFVGMDFNTTRAGIQADGLTKNEEIYNIFDTEKYLKRPCKVAISNTSGLAGVAYWIQSNIPKGIDIRKDNPGIVTIKNWIDEEYRKGRTTTISEEEMFKLVREYMPELF